MPPKSKKNYKGRSSNVLRYIESCGNEGDVGSFLASNLAVGVRLAAENEDESDLRAPAHVVREVRRREWR